MNIFDSIQAWRDRRAASNYDPVEERKDVAHHLAATLAGLGYDIVGIKLSDDGPLGGQSSRVTFRRILVDGSRQDFYVSIYAKGVYASDNAAIRELISP